ncbi:Trafficking protein particle complex subunit 13, partial [Cucurbita argyrosperma subsp. argyrosperma]
LHKEGRHVVIFGLVSTPLLRFRAGLSANFSNFPFSLRFCVPQRTSRMNGAQGSHSLAFRVMRLCRPSFQVDSPLRLDPVDLVAGEDIFDDPLAARQLPRLLEAQLSDESDSDPSYSSRFLLHDSSDAMGLTGLLVLPQAFGAIYLGETFCSYISVNNSSDFEVRDVIIKAEIQTERQRILLLDSSKSPVETIRAGGRYDFIVEHDVKELGSHTLVCTALYNDGDGERKYLPQFFKFMVANPLSVRTKVICSSDPTIVRVVKHFLGESYQMIVFFLSQESTFLEACIENHTKSNLLMDQVDFEPSPNWNAVIINADEHHSELKSTTREVFKPPILVRSGGGIHNFLYQLKFSTHGSSPRKVEGSNILGKLQLTWRTNMGEPGRLQTQQILGSPIIRKELELHVVEMPDVIRLERPFTLHMRLTTQIERELGPFEVWMSQNGSDEEKVVMVNGLQTMVIPRVEPHGSTDFHLNLIATKPGVQRIAGIKVFDTREKKSYDHPLPDLEV